MIKSTFDLENKLISEGYDFVIGIDEAGRGPLAGPVVACAVVSKALEAHRNDFLETKKLEYDLICDSKTLSEKRRERLYNFILEHFYVGVGICDHKIIDRINILQATYLAMKKSIVSLNDRLCLSVVKSSMINDKLVSKKIILVDGNKKIPNLSMEQIAIVSGDKKVKSISAASIIAKVTRDRIMCKMNERYPEYNFAKHKGYGTKMHIRALKKYGPCEIHRRSFKPVKNSI